jgi:hypothetical protein
LHLLIPIFDSCNICATISLVMIISCFHFICSGFITLRIVDEIINESWSYLSPTHSHQSLNSNLSSPLISFVEIQHWSFSISFDPKGAIAIYFPSSYTTGVFFPGFIYPTICPFFEV